MAERGVRMVPGACGGGANQWAPAFDGLPPAPPPERHEALYNHPSRGELSGMTPFEAIQYVGTPIALVAFVVAVVAWVYRSRLVERRKLIEAAPEAERGKLLDATIRDFTTVNTETLTRDQRYQLALRLIEERSARTRVLALVGVLTAAMLAVVILFLPGTAAEAVGLVVRVSDQSGGFITSGSLTLDAGSGRETRAIGADGQVRFDNVPRSAFERGVSLTPRVSGYATSPAQLTAVPPDGVYYLKLTPVGTEVRGTVVDSARVPVAGAVLTFEGGTAVDTTDANGTFQVTLPQAPGSSVAVRAQRGGVVGYNDVITVPEAGSITLRFEGRT